MFSSRATATLFRQTRAPVRNLSKVLASVRWGALFPKELNYLRFLKKYSFDSNFTTVIDEAKLDSEYGIGTHDLFFSKDAIVDFHRLFSMDYEDLNGKEKQQRQALNKELKDTVSALCLRIDIGKAIHERNSEELMKLIGETASPILTGFKNFFYGKNNFQDHLAQLPPVQLNEITYISDYEFVHYPFLGPFKFKSLCRIANHLREKLEDMPHNFAGVLGTIPVSLTEKQAAGMGLEMELLENHQEHSLYLFNIAIVVTGHGSITFVPKRTPSDVDIRYPIIKYVMHDGRVYVGRERSEQDNPQRSGEVSQKLPTLESREVVHPGYTNMPLPRLLKTNNRIVQAQIGDGTVCIVPEVCLENSKGIGKIAVQEELQQLGSGSPLFKSSSFSHEESVYILQALIAYGAEDPDKSNIIGTDIHKHDRSPSETYIKRLNPDEKISPETLHVGRQGITLALFNEQKLSQHQRVADNNDRPLFRQ